VATEWALNATRFCLSATWPAGVADACYWGLPSISADDASFPALGYWRGYVWGPMAQLTWWAFEAYAHVPEVAVAKAALARQMQATFLEQWRLNRHVCENFSPTRGATECTGDKVHTRIRVYTAQHATYSDDHRSTPPTPFSVLLMGCTRRSASHPGGGSLLSAPPGRAAAPPSTVADDGGRAPVRFARLRAQLGENRTRAHDNDAR
jgi:hypothetical protein